MATIIVLVVLILVYAYWRRNNPSSNTSGLVFDYMGGHPEVDPALVRLRKEQDALVMEGSRRQNATIPIHSITAINVVNDNQVVNKGGGRSIGGAVVGGALFGPIGAIVGGQKGTKVKHFNHDTVRMIVKSTTGIEFALMFNGGDATYHRLIKTIGVQL